MNDRAELTECLRTRWARLRPEDVGLRAFGGRRRVPGLRREELGALRRLDGQGQEDRGLPAAAGGRAPRRLLASRNAGQADTSEIQVKNAD